MAKLQLSAPLPFETFKTVTRPGFGVRETGFTISNKDQVIDELLATIAADKGFEVDDVQGGYLTTHGSQPMSHAVPFFRDPETKKLMVANIQGKPGAEMIVFMPLEEYVFGNERFKSGSGQRGAYNSPMTMVPIFDASFDAAGLKKRAVEIQKQAGLKSSSKKDGVAARFDLVTGRPRNLLRLPLRRLHVVPDEMKYGNCSLWAGEMLDAAGAMPERSPINKRSPWPNRLTHRLLEKYGDRAVVVDIPRIEHAEHTLRSFKDSQPRTSPLTAVGLRFRKDFKYAPVPEYAIAVPPGIDEVPLIATPGWKDKLNIEAKIYRANPDAPKARRTKDLDTFVEVEAAPVKGPVLEHADPHGEVPVQQGEVYGWDQPTGVASTSENAGVPPPSSRST
ncbi:MAG: hypothetical protein IPJ65_30490 [Archangiaceae bacterium]|nr:hypothetical protein [Archangiaceae bacterium]